MEAAPEMETAPGGRPCREGVRAGDGAVLEMVAAPGKEGEAATGMERRCTGGERREERGAEGSAERSRFGNRGLGLAIRTTLSAASASRPAFPAHELSHRGPEQGTLLSSRVPAPPRSPIAMAPPPPPPPPPPSSRRPTPTASAAPGTSSSRIDSPSLKAALALALIHYNRQPGRANANANANFTATAAAAAAAAAAARTSPPPLVHWKRKAKDRKREILRLREELKLLQDGARGEEMEPPVASCRCHFFDGCGDLPSQQGGEHWVDEVLRRRFLRLVRWKEKRRRVDRPLPNCNLIDFNSEDEMRQLSMSIDFLVELSDGIFAKREAGPSFSTFSHQAVDFILATLKNILSSKREKELVGEIIDGLVTRLMKRMCTVPENPGTSDSGSAGCSDAQFSVQNLFRKLGNDEFIGQRVILAVSQKISNVSERLLLVDPFDDAFPDMHDNIFIMIQLLEFLISDYMKVWLCCEHIDKRLFEECTRSVLKARNDLQILENMNGLYVVYIERVVGRLAREVAPAAHQGKLDLEVFSKLLC